MRVSRRRLVSKRRTPRTCIFVSVRLLDATFLSVSLCFSIFNSCSRFYLTKMFRITFTFALLVRFPTDTLVFVDFKVRPFTTIHLRQETNLTLRRNNVPHRYTSHSFQCAQKTRVRRTSKRDPPMTRDHVGGSCSVPWPAMIVWDLLGVDVRRGRAACPTGLGQADEFESRTFSVSPTPRVAYGR